MPIHYLVAGAIILLIIIGSILSKKILINGGAALALPGLAAIWDSLPSIGAQFYGVWGALLTIGLVVCWNMYVVSREPESVSREYNIPGT